MKRLIKDRRAWLTFFLIFILPFIICRSVLAGDASVTTAPSGVQVKADCFDGSYSSPGTLSSWDDLGVTPLSNKEVSCSNLVLEIGRTVLQRSQYEQGQTTEKIKLWKWDGTTSPSYNFVLKGIFYDSSFGSKMSSDQWLRFKEPRGIYADIKNGDGYLYIADPVERTVQALRYMNGSSNVYYSNMASFESGSSGISPYGVAAYGDSVFVVGKNYFNNGVIRKYARDSLNNENSYVEGFEISGFPYAVAADSAGNIYVVHKDSNQVTKWDNLLNGLASFGSQGSNDGQFNAPVGIDVDNDGNIYVADSGNNRIQMFDKNLKFVKSIKALDRGGYLDIYSKTDSAWLNLSNPTAVTADKYRSGIIYVLSEEDTSFPKGMIYAIDVNGSYKIVSFYRGEGYSKFPPGITIDKDNKIYVTDLDNFRVNVFKPSVTSLGSLSGTVMDGNNSQPLKSAQITLKKQVYDAYYNQNTYKVASDENGSFTLKDLVVGAAYGTPNPYQLTIDTSGYAKCTISDIEIINGQTTSLGNILMSAASNCTQSGFNLTVKKTPTGEGKVTSSPDGIDCGQTCQGHYSANTNVTLTATADPAYIFTGWSDSSCSSTGTCTVPMTSGTTISASFARGWNIEVSKSGTGSGSIKSADGSIDCGSSCSKTMSINTDITLVATTEPGSIFQGWGGKCTGTNTTCKVFSYDQNTIPSDSELFGVKTVTAEFAKQGNVVSVTKAGSGSGKVKSSPAGINCGSTCTGVYKMDAKTKVTLTATPDKGSKFTGWGGYCSGTKSICKLSMETDRAVTTTFDLIQYSLTAKVVGKGTVTSSDSVISCGSNCKASYNYGSSVTLTAVPSAGYKFTGWKGGGCKGTGTCTSKVNNNTTITATFKKI